MNLLECASENETTKTFKPALLNTLLNKEFADKMYPETLKKLEPYILYEERYGEGGDPSNVTIYVDGKPYPL